MRRADGFDITDAALIPGGKVMTILEQMPWLQPVLKHGDRHKVDHPPFDTSTDICRYGYAIAWDVHASSEGNVVDVHSRNTFCEGYPRRGA